VPLNERPDYLHYLIILLLILRIMKLLQASFDSIVKGVVVLARAIYSLVLLFKRKKNDTGTIE
jgi:hypothetical protein